MELKCNAAIAHYRLKGLLIVPYGIEITQYSQLLTRFPTTFNRTLWN